MIRFNQRRPQQHPLEPNLEEASRIAESMASLNSSHPSVANIRFDIYHARARVCLYQSKWTEALKCVQEMEQLLPSDNRIKDIRQKANKQQWH
jgi:hypothetical protein